MKSMIIVALALVAVAAALPVNEPTKIVKSSFDKNPDGSYTFEYETEDGSKRQEVGTPVEALDEDGKPHIVIVVRGAYSYVKEDGSVETIQYTANENGYAAEGPSVPKNERR
ncbi:hypothetical protein PYW08_014782 [Mythimna loreyi]|uniref:Uncharacterized protein n=1 Tax=Mythimna loreyi TaxID=667449 RepID=A0ACC2R452_9NEOP|nr:hypothetical protein PYW08_014782 [Mythimna loreyi]